MATVRIKKISPVGALKRKHGTSVSSASQQIRELIVHGRLSPGAWIDEAEIVKRLNLSRTPVRAALQWLQQEGYVREHRTATKCRMCVSPLTKEDANELYSVIGRVEGLAGRIVAELPKAKRMAIVHQLKHLNQQLGEIKDNPGQQGTIFDLDHDFHRLVLESGAGPRLRKWHKTIVPQIERYWRLYASSIINSLQISINEHNDIINALEAGDAVQMEHSMQMNWENGCERLGHVIDVFGERGSW